jgi:nucleoid-associated protein YgaU
MKRYARTQVKMDKSDMRVYSTTYYPRILLNNNDKFVRTKDGDRLDTMAYRFYKDTSLWWIIAKANGIRGKMALEIGKVIRIPSDITNIIEEFNSVNEGD